MRKLGLITIGQTPRVDIMPDIEPVFGPEIEILQAGALDGLTHEDIAKFAPENGDYVLISKLKDGTSAVFAEKHILPRLQGCIDKLEEQGAELIMFLCTGDFPEFKHNVPIYFPCNILNGTIPSLCKTLAVVTPVTEQIEQSRQKWEKYVENVIVVAASPYGDPEELDKACDSIAATNADLVLLDCMGFTSEMKARAQKKSGKFVVLSRTMAARVLSELLQ